MDLEEVGSAILVIAIVLAAVFALGLVCIALGWIATQAGLPL